jgi:hypothetical protein
MLTAWQGEDESRCSEAQLISFNRNSIWPCIIKEIDTHLIYQQQQHFELIVTLKSTV